jgi:hypothetical protein
MTFDELDEVLDEDWTPLSPLRTPMRMRMRFRTLFV